MSETSTDWENSLDPPSLLHYRPRAIFLEWGDFIVTVKIYGPTASRAARSLWIVHELGIPFEHMGMEMKDLKGAEFLKINPNGKVPALVDGDFKLFESMAINLYLAAKYSKDSLCDDGGDGSLYAVCDLGTGMAACELRPHPPSCSSHPPT